jgi:AAA15 family ATPase/GTPase
MIEDIEINNFRCFDRLKVSGCKRINLISGKNNIGKTALLEAIFLSSTPTRDTIFSLSEMRRETGSFREVSQEKIWNKFFFQQDSNFTCSIELKLQNRTKTIKMSIDNNYEKLLANDYYLRNYFANTHDNENTKEPSDNNNVNPYILLLEIQIDDREPSQLRIISRSHKISSIKDIDRIEGIQNSYFIPSFSKSSSVSLTKEFDRARLNEKDEEVLKAFQIIDNSMKH